MKRLHFTGREGQPLNSTWSEQTKKSLYKIPHRSSLSRRHSSRGRTTRKRNTSSPQGDKKRMSLPTIPMASLKGGSLP